MAEESDTHGSLEMPSMTSKCSRGVKKIMEKEIVRSGDLLSTLSANKDSLHLDVAFADLLFLVVKTWEWDCNLISLVERLFF